MKQAVRTRFAPSPTGFLHVGNARAALFPWLIAKHNGGKFILRIEDTDQAREVAGAVDVIRDTLNWLGIEWDEGPDKGGPFEPYVQSERKDLYIEWAKKLIAQGRAYADTRTAEELDELRKDAQAKKAAFLARNYRPENPPEWKLGMPLRFKSEPKAYQWHDAVMGDLSAGPEAVDDFIMIKSDGFPTYNFAHIVDDAVMEMTHVTRGLEYISSMPKYLNLYEALGLEVPILVHMPHILGPDGKKKLSKRDGAKGILDYANMGYLPEAMINFLASLGWNDGTEQEIFSRDELIAKFTPERIQRSGAKFDDKRLEWMNGHYIRQLSVDELYERAKDFWPPDAKDASLEYKKQVLVLVQERLKYLAEIPDLTRFFFTDLPVDKGLIENNKYLSSMSRDDLKTLLETSKAELADSDFSVEDLTNRLNGLLGLTHTKPGVLFSLIRIATTEAPASPALAGTLSALGKETSLRRIGELLAAL